MPAIRLSPTTGLNLFSECPKCFWLHFNRGVHRPRGIFPSLPGGMDMVIKRYFDQYRGALPPEIKGKVIGRLMTDLPLLNRWRDWRTGLIYADKERDAELFGALDDCLSDGDFYVPLDYKTRGYPPKPGDSEKYYQTQLDAYALLLDENGYPVRNFAYLVYYWPKTVGANGVVQFNVEPVKVATDLIRAKNTFETAADCLKGPMPKRHSACEYCVWLGDRCGFE